MSDRNTLIEAMLRGIVEEAEGMAVLIPTPELVDEAGTLFGGFSRSGDDMYGLTTVSWPNLRVLIEGAKAALDMEDGDA